MENVLNIHKMVEIINTAIKFLTFWILPKFLNNSRTHNSGRQQCTIFIRIFIRIFTKYFMQENRLPMLYIIFTLFILID